MSLHAVGGHFLLETAYLPYIRTFTGGNFAVNTGSVGQSKENRISAAYLMLTIAESRIQAEIVRVAYPVEDD